MDYVQDRFGQNEYYHGTTCDSAIQILYEGFRLKKSCSPYGKSGTFKQAIYLTKDVDVAALFSGGYIFRCRLDTGASILWLDNSYDQKVINYLKKEFSKQILTEPISKTIPRNKNLTKSELIHLLNYRFQKVKWHLKKDREQWASTVGSLRQQLQLHKYNGVGETKTEVGVAIFDPSYVKPLDLFHCVFKDNRNSLLPLNSKQLLNDLYQHQRDLAEYFEAEGAAERDRLISLQERFSREKESFNA